eukprot:3285658-Rhodomonas_salina.3
MAGSARTRGEEQADARMRSTRKAARGRTRFPSVRPACPLAQSEPNCSRLTTPSTIPCATPRDTSALAPNVVEQDSQKKEKAIRALKRTSVLPSRSRTSSLCAAFPSAGSTIRRVADWLRYVSTGQRLAGAKAHRAVADLHTDFPLCTSGLALT